MATMNGVIEYVDSVKPNVYPESAKYTWINTLEGMISLEVMQMEEPVCYSLPNDASTPLLVQSPFDDIYGLYVSAMIDFYNKEYSNYNNSVLMFTERLEQYKAWYIQNHRPVTYPVKVMG